MRSVPMLRYLCFGLFLAGGLLAGPARVIHLNRLEDWAAGTLKSVRVGDRGHLLLGYNLRGLEVPQRSFLLSATRDDRGRIWVGTGHHASIFSVPGPGVQGEVAEWYSLQQPDLHGLTWVAGEGIYAAASPDGRVERVVEKSGKPEARVVYDGDSKVIWSLVPHPRGGVLAALGQPGGVVWIHADGSAQSLLDQSGSHILSVWASEDGVVYAGSGAQGTVFRIEGGKARVLAQVPHPEVRALVGGDSGNIYVLATRGNDAPVTENPAGANGPTLEVKREQKGAGALYEISPQGAIREIWRQEQAYLYTMVRDEAGAFWIGTGNQGQVFRVSATGAAELVCQTDSAQVTGLLPMGDGWLVVGNNSASLAHLSTREVSAGSFESRIYDLGAGAQIGRVGWIPVLSGGGVAVSLRAGNTRLPDETWRDWSPPFQDPDGGRLNWSGYRYIQLRVGLSRTGQGVEDLFVFTRQQNSAPRITRVDLVPSGSGSAAAGTGTSTPAVTPPQVAGGMAGAAAKGGQGMLQLKWKAEDANGDELRATLFLQALPQGPWMEVPVKWEGGSCRLDPDLFAPGWYRLRLRVDDGPDQPQDRMLYDDWLSAPVALDGEAPELVAQRHEKGGVVLVLRDRVSAIRRVRFSRDGQDWRLLEVRDGLADGLEEEVWVPLQEWGSAEVLFLQVEDERGNRRTLPLVRPGKA